ncbi:MAG: hypothetical protein ACPGLV_00660 [Bacteroidia bacterium]
MQILFVIIFTSFSFFLTAQDNSTGSLLVNSEWLLTHAQHCELDMENAIDECSEILKVPDNEILVTFLDNKKVLFAGEEYYYWIPTADSLLLATENWNKKRKTPTIGYTDMAYTFKVKGEKLFLEEKILGEYGEFGDYTYGEIGRFFFIKN